MSRNEARAMTENPPHDGMVEYGYEAVLGALKILPWQMMDAVNGYSLGARLRTTHELDYLETMNQEFDGTYFTQDILFSLTFHRADIEDFAKQTGMEIDWKALEGKELNEAPLFGGKSDVPRKLVLAILHMANGLEGLKINEHSTAVVVKAIHSAGMTVDRREIKKILDTLSPAKVNALTRDRL